MEKTWVEFRLKFKATGPAIALSSIIPKCKPARKVAPVALEIADFNGMVAHLPNSERQISHGPRHPFRAPLCSIPRSRRRSHHLPPYSRQHRECV